MKFGAVDIGSNAARLQISRVLVHKKNISFKRIEYVRFPLRLGLEVFKNKWISSAKEEQLIKLLHAFKLLLELHEVDDFRVVATSAMREAQNGSQIVKRAQEELNILLEVISSEQEARLVNVGLMHLMDDRNYLHIDVGGGSTELTLFSQKKVVISQSFDIGSVRLLEEVVLPQTWVDLKDWVETHIKPITPKPIAVGIGGNINKVTEISGKKSKILTIRDIEAVQLYLQSYSQGELVNELGLNPDRADVILPALKIYLSVMQWAKIKQILTPGLGLKDGIIELLAQKHDVHSLINIEN